MRGRSQEFDGLAVLLCVLGALNINHQISVGSLAGKLDEEKSAPRESFAILLRSRPHEKALSLLDEVPLRCQCFCFCYNYRRARSHSSNG